MWCLTLIVNIALRQVECPEQNLSYPIAIPRSDINIHKGEWFFRSILYKPKAHYGTILPESKIGSYVMCLNIPDSNSCFHGWYDESVINQRLRISSECYRMRREDIKDLWLRVTTETRIIIK